MESRPTEKRPTAMPNNGTDPDPDPETGAQFHENRDEIRKPAQHHTDGSFDGSFAGTLRNRSEIYSTPWYRRRDYFLSGWTDASIWRAAVRLLRLH